MLQSDIVGYTKYSCRLVRRGDGSEASSVIQSSFTIGEACGHVNGSPTRNFRDGGRYCMVVCSRVLVALIVIILSAARNVLNLNCQSQSGNLANWPDFFEAVYADAIYERMSLRRN